MRHSVLVFICTDARPPAVLLLKRTCSRGGWWQPVTGHVEPGETPQEAAGREVWEETGWRPQTLMETPWTCDFRHRGEAYRHTVWVALTDRPFFPLLSDEHEEGRWMDLETAAGLLYWPDNREMLRRVMDWLNHGWVE